jgi:tetratricopeptide (TPR) repeat protein
LRRQAAQQDSTSAAAKRDLGAVLDAQGDLQAEQGNSAAALEAYRQAHELYAALCKKEPDNLEDQWYLGHSHYRLGTAHQLAGDAARAARELSESLKVREAMVAKDPGSVQLRTELILARAHCGQHAEAARAAAKLRRQVSKHPGVLFSVARAYALCVAAVGSGKGPVSAAEQALQRQYTEAALEALRQAIRLGYKDREALRLEPDLSALRGSTSFQALLEQLPKP